MRPACCCLSKWYTMHAHTARASRCRWVLLAWCYLPCIHQESYRSLRSRGRTHQDDAAHAVRVVVCVHRSKRTGGTAAAGAAAAAALHAPRPAPAAGRGSTTTTTTAACSGCRAGAWTSGRCTWAVQSHTQRSDPSDIHRSVVKLAPTSPSPCDASSFSAARLLLRRHVRFHQTFSSGTIMMRAAVSPCRSDHSSFPSSCGEVPRCFSSTVACCFALSTTAHGPPMGEGDGSAHVPGRRASECAF